MRRRADTRDPGDRHPAGALDTFLTTYLRVSMGFRAVQTDYVGAGIGFLQGFMRVSRKLTAPHKLTTNRRSRVRVLPSALQKASTFRYFPSLKRRTSDRYHSFTTYGFRSSALQGTDRSGPSLDPWAACSDLREGTGF